MHKNKYDHNILLNDIQKLDKIQHKHSLVAIQFPDTSAEKKYLVYYDERWDCKLFLNYKTVDRADEESVINKVSADLNVDKMIIPGLFEPPVRTLRATIPENESHIFR